MLARDQAEIGHELAWVREACEVADFRDQHHRIDQRDTSHRLQRVDNWAQIPFGKKAGYLFFDPLQAPFRIHDGIDIVLKLSLIHISEPTRRTPISYAVFCLKKKKK